MIKFMPVYSPRAVMNAWKVLLPGFMEILKYTFKDTSLTKIYNELIAGELLLWIIYVNNEEVGFLTTKIEVVPDMGRNLWVVHMNCKGQNKSIWLDGLDILLKFGKENGCQTIRFMTQREAVFDRKLEDMGFRKSYVEYLKEI